MNVVFVRRPRHVTGGNVERWRGMDRHWPGPALGPAPASGTARHHIGLILASERSQSQRPIDVSSWPASLRQWQ